MHPSFNRSYIPGATGFRDLSSGVPGALISHAQNHQWELASSAGLARAVVDRLSAEGVTQQVIPLKELQQLQEAGRLDGLCDIGFKKKDTVLGTEYKFNIGCVEISFEISGHPDSKYLRARYSLGSYDDSYWGQEIVAGYNGQIHTNEVRHLANGHYVESPDFFETTGKTSPVERPHFRHPDAVRVFVNHEKGLFVTVRVPAEMEWGLLTDRKAFEMVREPAGSFGGDRFIAHFVGGIRADYRGDDTIRLTNANGGSVVLTELGYAEAEEFVLLMRPMGRPDARQPVNLAQLANSPFWPNDSYVFVDAPKYGSAYADVRVYVGRPGEMDSWTVKNVINQSPTTKVITDKGTFYIPPPPKSVPGEKATFTTTDGQTFEGRPLGVRSHPNLIASLCVPSGTDNLQIPALGAIPKEKRAAFESTSHLAGHMDMYFNGGLHAGDGLVFKQRTQAGENTAQRSELGWEATGAHLPETGETVTLGFCEADRTTKISFTLSEGVLYFDHSVLGNHLQRDSSFGMTVTADHQTAIRLFEAISALSTGVSQGGDLRDLFYEITGR